MLLSSINRSELPMKHVLLLLSLAIGLDARADLTNGLVAFYPFNGNANDASGHGLNGTVFNATLANDRFGNPASAYSFTGSSDCYISVPSAPALQLTTNLTISFWMNRSSVAPYADIICKGDAEQSYSVTFDTVNANSGIGFNRQNAVVMALSRTPTPTNQWMQVVCTLDRTNAVIYYNGTIVTNGVGVTLGTGNGALTFGTIRSGTPASFSGLLDDIRIYNRALSTAEVQQLYLYEAELPSLSVAVSKIKVTEHVIVGHNYILESSSDLNTWTPVGTQFTAQSEAIDQEFDVAQTGRYFRIHEVP